MPLQDFAGIELHNALIYRVRHRGSHVGSNKVLDPSYLFRIALGNHDLQLVVHVNLALAHETSSLELPQMSEIDGCIYVRGATILFTVVIPAAALDR